MALDKTDIANIAGRDVGASEISDIDTDNGKVASTIRTYWDAVVDEVLGDHRWSFAKKMKALAADSDYDMVDDKYAYAYEKPSDYIRIARMNVAGTNFQRRGNHLLSNLSPFIVEYIYRHENAVLWPSYFYMTIAALLASYIALPLSGKGTKNVDWKGIYLLRLEEGKKKDAMEDDPIDVNDGLHSVANEPWLTVRD